MIKNTKELDKDQVYKLYEANEWIAYLHTFDNLMRGIENSFDVYTYEEDGKLIGLIRVIGDGETIIYIQDILILPEYQGTGIGSQLIQTVLEKYKHVRQITLMTDMEPKQHSFYKKNGFTNIADIGCAGFTVVKK